MQAQILEEYCRPSIISCVAAVNTVLYTCFLFQSFYLCVAAIVSSVFITCNSPCIIQQDNTAMSVVEGTSCDCSCTATDGYPQDLNLTWNVQTATDTVNVSSTRIPETYDFSSNITFTPSVTDTMLICSVEGYTVETEPHDIQKKLNLDVQCKYNNTSIR